MPSSQRTTKSIKEELPRLIRWDKISVNKLARQLDISATHISRSCNPAHPETFGGGLAGRTALYFGLPEDYFVEFRREFLLDLIRNDLDLCDQLYDAAKNLLAHRDAIDDVLSEAGV